MANRIWIPSLLACWLLGLAGCALSWQEADGSRRVIGFVALRLTDAADHPTFAGTAVDLTTIGLGIAATGEETIVSLGYLNITTAKLRDNALVIGNPLALRNVATPMAVP